MLLKHESLRLHPMPPRITKESHRPRVSDRTMSYRLSGRITTTLVCFRKPMAPSRQEMEPQGERRISPFRVTTRSRIPEQDLSPLASARSNSWAERRDKKLSALSRRGDISLDVRFYRTSPVSAFTRTLHRSVSLYLQTVTGCTAITLSDLTERHGPPIALQHRGKCSRATPK